MLKQYVYWPFRDAVLRELLHEQICFKDSLPHQIEIGYISDLGKQPIAHLFLGILLKRSKNF